ncbi:imelysin family protein [Spongiimicrobium salis]|uniref:imelysin family protein n=1 Tax=Spongiimicrobium salis TaxID=1667022 RepID=UPI00374DAF95
MHTLFRKKHIILCGICAFVGLLFLANCKSDDNSSNLNDTEALLRDQLTNVFSNEIVSLNANFMERASTLQEAAEAFQRESTLQNLENAQEQWRNLQLVWKQLELYDLGDVGNSFIAFEINRWPSNTSRIEDNITGTTELNEAFIASIGSSSKGISGVEYLLFPSEEGQDILGSFTGSNGDRRLQYLVAMTQNLTTKTSELNDLWNTFSPTFTTALESNISGSQNQLANAMISLLEEIIVSKLGRALGDNNGGTIITSQLEAFRSTFSKEIIRQHLTALQRTYQGEFGAASTIGFDDFILRLEQQALDQRIQDQFTVCRNALDRISGSLAAELETNPDAVAAVRTAFRDLLVLIRVDMSNLLGIVVTFNDSDGD